MPDLVPQEIGSFWLVLISVVRYGKRVIEYFGDVFQCIPVPS